MTQFAMVEELASLIKDNLYCKHLILSTEEALNNFLQHNSSPEAVLELQPMTPYQRLLLHRLADIYGFAHESVGEGEERHLLLERSPETAIPPILVSDILWEYGEYQSTSPAHLILRRKASPEKKDKIAPSSTSLEVREAAYLAARERIFALQEDNEKEPAPPKSRKVPVVAQRMIAHALGQKLSSLHIHEENDKSDNSITCTPDNANETGEISEKKMSSRGGTHRKATNPEKLEKEQIGAAKRIFAQALGIGSSNRSPDARMQSNEGKPALGH